MDAGELGRQAAAALHDAAVAKGGDPWNSYAFALAEAKNQGLKVNACAPGSHVLDGGRATYDPEDRLIIHEDAGTPFDQAFLVAHEIGHVVLGDDPDEVVVNTVDPARVAEAMAGGLEEGLADYGRRQRREVQMDLFARELLLPRGVARRLFVEEGLGASAIAAKLGAPFDMVAQQLLDTLLLPHVAPPAAEEERVLRPLNEQQAGAASHRGEAYLLEAGPGTGKTQTLVGRVERLLADGVDPRRILLLTFSNKAAGEMAERIARDNPEAAAAMWIGTFHAFGLDLIRRFHDRLGLPDNPRMLDRTEAVELLEDEFPRLRLIHYRDHYDPTQIISDLLSAISRAKDEVVDPEEYARLAQRMAVTAGGDADNRVAAEKASEVAEVYALYEGLKRARQAIDFGDLISIPVRLLEDDEEARAQLQNRYDHILVDEYQDVNRSSVRLLTALKPDGRGLWAVGDAKQSVYRFRGASSFNMARFGDQDFPNGEHGLLVVNYRSSAEIVAAFSTFGTAMQVATPGVGLEAARGPLERLPELVRYGTKTDQAAAVAESIEHMRGEGFRLSDHVILCSGNDRLTEVAAELETAGVPVLFLGSLFERAEVKELLSFLTLLVDGRAMGLVLIGASREFAMGLADVAAVLGCLGGSEKNPTPIRWRSHLPAIRSVLSDEGRTTLQNLCETLEGFDETSSPWRFLATVILDRSGIGARYATASDVAGRTGAMAVWQFMNFLRAQPAGQGLPAQRLLDRIRRLVRLGDDRELRQLPAAAQELDGVRLMTIHGSKGLEFPVVHLLGMNKGSLPRTAPLPSCLPPNGLVKEGDGDAVTLFRAGQSEEQECLFYVALSRARDRLMIYAARETTDGKRREVSSFVDRLGPTIRRTESGATATGGVAERLIPVGGNGPLDFEATEIAIYERCPRRFLYSRVLRAGGRRTMTPFMLMHEAVRTTINSVHSGDIVLDHADSRSILLVADAACIAQGLEDHGYRADFARISASMIERFLKSRDSWTAKPPGKILVPIGADGVIVRADELRSRPGGPSLLVKVQTGRKRAADDNDLVAAAHQLAARTLGSSVGARIEYLTDGGTTDVALTNSKLATRHGKIADTFADIRAGRFPPKPSAYSCPGCPAFFICGSLPDGSL
jgi:superfamily I DNA/RNA helicase